ncbi:MAG TPA: DUF998 domain-containing protein [Jiangellaceae bacterium]|nr:DUF998 domain-containing protein [Jiangellaceae bacterium]
MVHRRRLTQILLSCGVAAGPLLVTVDVLGALARDDYDVLRHPVSSLALGPGGWAQTANFCMAGALSLAGAVGLARSEHTTTRHVGPLLVGVTALGLFGVGAFTTDAVGGYPPGTPEVAPGYTTAGALHDLLSAPAFLGLPTAAFVYAWWFRRRGEQAWARYSVGTAVGMLTVLALSSGASFNQMPAFFDYGGLLQRTGVGIGVVWFSALAVRAYRGASRDRGMRSPGRR